MFVSMCMCVHIWKCVGVFVKVHFVRAFTDIIMSKCGWWLFFFCFSFFVFLWVFFCQGKWSMPSIRNFWKYTVITYWEWNCFSSQHHTHLSLEAHSMECKCYKCNMLFLYHFSSLNAFCTWNTIPRLYIWYLKNTLTLLLEFSICNK